MTFKQVQHFRDQEWEKIKNIWFSVQFLKKKNSVLKTTDTQVLKNSTLHHKISRFGGEDSL